MRNSLNAVVFGAIIMFSAGLQAEVHQHAEMSAASEGASEQVITGSGIVKVIDLTNKKSDDFSRSHPGNWLARDDHAFYFYAGRREYYCLKSRQPREFLVCSAGQSLFTQEH